MEQCPYSQQLSAFHDGELSAEQRREVEQHLRGACPVCEAELRQWQRFSSLISHAPFPKLSEASRERLYELSPWIREAGYVRLAEWTTGLAAAVLIAVSGWMLVNRQSPQATPEPQSWARYVLNPNESSDLTSDGRAEPQFADWVVTNLAASGKHD